MRDRTTTADVVWNSRLSPTVADCREEETGGLTPRFTASSCECTMTNVRNSMWHAEKPKVLPRGTLFAA